MPTGLRIFISYARRDAGELAANLHRDLTALGHDAWLDVEHLHGGDHWAKETEAQLDRSDIVLALLSEGSFASDICRAEQGWALDAGKRVIPIRVQKHAKPQLRLAEHHYLDFSDPAAYDDSFRKLQDHLD